MKQIDNKAVRKERQIKANDQCFRFLCTSVIDVLLLNFSSPISLWQATFLNMQTVEKVGGEKKMKLIILNSTEGQDWTHLFVLVQY